MDPPQNNIGNSLRPLKYKPPSSATAGAVPPAGGYSLAIPSGVPGPGFAVLFQFVLAMEQPD